MDFRSETKQQHFVSQVEQRFNSINPNADKDNQRIYSFSLKKRDSYMVTMDSKKGINISNNLKILHLFSFDILEDDIYRNNFESLFESYESSIRDNTNSLIVNLEDYESDIQSEIINIFRSKILNFVRNPYSMIKVLSTFSSLKGVYPTNSIRLKNFNRVLEGKNPQQNYICKILGITEKDYRDWLATIFILLNSMEKDNVNFLDQAIIGLLEDPNLYTRVYIYTYDEKSCLLSDRGFNLYTKDNTTVWEFNLYSYGFIRYVFENIDHSELSVDKKTLDRFKSIPKEISVKVLHNDLIALEIYNKNTVELCYKKVFNCSLTCYGINVV